MDASVLLTILGMAGALLLYFERRLDDQSKKSDKIDQKVELVKKDMDNHKDNHKKLEERFTIHENKLDEVKSDIGEIKGDLKVVLSKLP